MGQVKKVARAVHLRHYVICANNMTDRLTAPQTAKGRLDKFYHLAKQQGYRYIDFRARCCSSCVRWAAAAGVRVSGAFGEHDLPGPHAGHVPRLLNGTDLLLHAPGLL